MSRIILVSNRLPIRLADGGKPVRTTGGLASALEGAGVLDEAIWVGWPGVSSAELEENPAMGESLAELGVVPVSLSAAEMEGFYEGYSNSTLWPLLHQMLDRARFESGWAEAYRAANERFAEAVLRVAKEGDTVWVHDYHLFLLPELLREALPGLRIGFFPAHAVPQQRHRARAAGAGGDPWGGLLGADLIGFHTYNYLRHFRSALLRVLGVESEVDSLGTPGARCGSASILSGTTTGDSRRS
ncbi:MAG: trehalose-6-phosphate synthase [Verrucomicrobiales bacterium]